MTLSESIEAFLKRYPAKTQEAYRNALKRFCTASDFTTIAQFEALTRKEFPGIIYRLDCSKATVKHTVAAVRSFYRFLRSTSDIEDPTDGFKSPAVGDNVPAWNVLHQGEAQAVLEQIIDLHDRAVFLGLIMQGWRVSELCAMQWKNIRQTQTGDWVVEWKGKRRKQRVQGLQAAVLEAVRGLGGVVKPSSPFIPTPKGEAWTRYEVYGLVTRYAKLAGKRVTPHGLRATYISSVINRKGIEAARQLAGHQSLDTTLRYSRWVVTSDDPRTVEDL